MLTTASGHPCGPFSCEQLAAAQLLGAVLNWCLYGSLVVQFYLYSYNFSQDNRCFKQLVYSIFFLETVQTVLSGADLYHWFVAGFGESGHLTPRFVSFVDVPMMGSVVALTVQLFFVYRIFKLGEKRSWWLCVIICLLSIIGALAAFVAGVFSYLMYGYLGESLRLKVFEMTWITANTLSDLLIASAMLYHLRRIWAKHGKLSRHILMSIVRLMVETNLMTSIVSIVTLLMVCLHPRSKWYVCPTYILGKLHSNTLLVSVNNRNLLHDSYNARGVVVDCEVEMRLRSGDCPGSTDTIMLGPEKPHNDCMNTSVAEAEVEERVNTPATIPHMSTPPSRRNRH